LTTRWDGIQMKDMDGWAESGTRRIQITLGLCSEPIGLTVRKYIPIEGDVLARHWVDGTVKKTKTLEPYAIANIHAAAAEFRQYIDTNAFQCIDSVLANSEPLIRETYNMAKRHLRSATVRT
jgi:hypothetical protein